MAIKVDLDCEKCLKKIKKVLCSIPQIQSQVYDEKINIVIITVYCCCPEKVMKKICCKGGKTVKSIQIIVPEKPKEKPTVTEKNKGTEKTEETGKNKGTEKTEATGKTKETQKTTPVEPAAPVQQNIVLVYPPPEVQPRTCCRECYEGHGYGPCYYGTPVPCYEGYGRPVYDSWGGRGCYVSRCDYYLCEENPHGCAIM